MSRPFVQLHLHVVWATWQRQPWIVPAVEAQLHAAIVAKCRALGAVALAVGGVEDHVHLLVSMTASLAPCRLVGEVKGASSHLMTHAISPGSPFRWQSSYGVIAVGHRGIDAVRAYVLGQRARHARGQLIALLERISDDGT